MQVKCIPVGPAMANCYIISCSGQKEALVIDPGDQPQLILRYMDQQGIVPALVVNTHGHVDHIGANAAMKEAGVRICVHRLDARALTDSEANLSNMFGGLLPPVVGPAPDELLDDGSVVRLGRIDFGVIHTPGHTPGGICLLGKSRVFTGDTLFLGSIGRTDFPGSDHAAMLDSINRKLMVLPDDLQVFPGHGPSTTIGEERRTNPYLCGWET